MQRRLGPQLGGFFRIFAVACGLAASADPTDSAVSPNARGSSGTVVNWWRSTEDLRDQLSPQPALRFESASRSSREVIEVDDTVAHQSILGLGSSLEHSTCYNLSLLPAERRERVIESLVHPERGLGMNLMRICIGTSDFAPGPFYTYDDLPEGREDHGLERFSIDRDREYVLPVLKAAQRLNPELRFFASPWTPPPWMKTNGRYGGGSLRSECYPYFAEYLARFIEAYRREGIEVHAITIQNEPEFAPEAYPSCLWTAKQQRDFIRDYLGPLFEARGIRTLIWCFDHNFNNPAFPATILRDPAAARFVEGTGFHLYEGKPSAMSRLRREFPGKSIYFTEGSVYGVQGAVEMIKYFRNWARSYNAWVTLIDHRGKPNVSGFHDCDPTMVVLNRDTLSTEYRADYYIYGQFMKFIQRGAVRIGSSPGNFANIAFRNPDGTQVLIVAHPHGMERRLAVAWDGQSFAVTLGPKSIATFVWKP
ncbi:MAG: hypothetical protein JNK85_04495 [Verrucomicrobiales bacterium]|nr:hypothetical protein [Verrucomicrobiales bacterium]